MWLIVALWTFAGLILVQNSIEIKLKSAFEETMQYFSNSTFSVLVVALLFVATGAFYQRIPVKTAAFSSSSAARYVAKNTIITRNVERKLKAVIEDFGDGEQVIVTVQPSSALTALSAIYFLPIDVHPFCFLL